MRQRSSLLLTPFFTGVAGILFGTLIDLWFQTAPLMAVAGGVSGFPFGLYLHTKRRRWLAVVLLNAEFVAAYAVGGIWALLLAVAASGLAFFVSAAILREFYGSSEFAAFVHHLQIATGLIRDFQVIDDGKTVLPSVVNSAEQLLGPRNLTVRPGNAVVTVDGIQYRAYGPSRFITKPGEYVKHVYDLREKQKRFPPIGALLSDGTLINLKVSLTYGLSISDRAKQGVLPNKPKKPLSTTKDIISSLNNALKCVRDWLFPWKDEAENLLTKEEQTLLCSMPFTMPEWDKAVEGALESTVQRIARKWSIEDFSKMEFDVIEGQIRESLAKRTEQWGVQVHQVILENLQVPTRSTGEETKESGK